MRLINRTPLVIRGVFGITLQNENLAVGTLLILFAIGYVLFCKADKLNKERVA
ncbi:MAG: DUF2611 domain-containing protein [Alistipes sp.]|nr:DUF2611 domain-containing protein [Alistipes sp.]